MPPSAYDPTDAVYAAVRLLCANGRAGGADVSGAVYAYNHSKSRDRQPRTSSRDQKERQHRPFEPSSSAVSHASPRPMKIGVDRLENGETGSACGDQFRPRAGDGDTAL